MKKEKAIALLRLQQEKLKTLNHKQKETWIIQTAAYVKQFFGEGSKEYDYISKYKFWSVVWSDTTDEQFQNSVDNQKPTLHTFAGNCIETIENFGLKKREWKHALITTDPKIFWAVFSAIVALAFWLGTKYSK
jgi:hypothetical protein